MGRLSKPVGSGTPVFLQLIDPKAFAGIEAFTGETSFLAKSCRSSRPRAGIAAVRMPGDSALARRRAQLDKGVELYPSIMPDLSAWAERFGIRAPAPSG
jgi:L-lactate dehydrogenase